MALKDWARKKNRELHREAFEDRDSRLWHSHSYHRYFEGYTEYRELDQNGKEQLRRVYTAAWHIQDLDRKRVIGIRILYLALFLLMAGAVVQAGVRPGSGNAFYTALAELAVLCLLAWLGYILLVNYLFMPKKMTIHDYHSSSIALKRVALALSIAFAVSACAVLLENALKGDASGAIVPVAAFLGGAACAFGMHMAEEKVPYREIANEKAGKAAGIEIGE